MNIQKITRTMALAACGVTAAFATLAEFPGVQFSADMVSRSPDAPPSSGKMYVGDGRIRIEMTQEGRDIVRIDDRHRQLEWVLFPDRKRYLERRASQSDAAPAPMAAPSAESDPCVGLQDVSCRRAGTEDVGGRAAIKWEMIVTREGKTLAGAQWLDAQRGLPLKYLMPNGQSMELKMIGNETLDGRAVEKWEMTTAIPDRQPLRTFQWYDPELKLSVREEFPGGQVRELNRIRLGTQPDELFTVPAGYSRMDPTAPPSR